MVIRIHYLGGGTAIWSFRCLMYSIAHCMVVFKSMSMFLICLFQIIVSHTFPSRSVIRSSIVAWRREPYLCQMFNTFYNNFKIKCITSVSLSSSRNDNHANGSLRWKTNENGLSSEAMSTTHLQTIKPSGRLKNKFL